MNAALSGAAVLLLWQLAAPAQEATIRGRVLDPDGQPMQDVFVITEMVGAERRMTAGRRGNSNAAGAFEITGVPAGMMIIRAEPRVTIGVVKGKSTRNPRVQHPPAFFPGVLDRMDAWPIDVKPGEIIELDFHMPPIFIGSIKTIVSGPDGYVLERVRVLRPEANQIKNITVADDGVGYVDSLREGRYAVAARARSRDALLAAHQIVHITGGEVTVTLSLEPTARVNGRVIVERGGLPPIDNTRVVAAWTDGTIDLDPLGRDEAHVGPDGSFTIDGLFGTRSFRLAGLRADWQVIAIRQGRSDITSSGIDLVPGSANEIAIVVAKR
jgi:hypothetical protein